MVQFPLFWPVCAGVALIACATAPAQSQTIFFRNLPNNGYFSPFTSATSNAIRYGDGGWLTGPGAPGQTVNQISLGLAVTGNGADVPAGTTDLTFTFNDGDPSGLVFGPGTTLYSKTLLGVELPAAPADTSAPVYFSVTIDMPPTTTAGGFNNIGFSIGVQNFAYQGAMGFQCSTSAGQQVGYYTNNASYFDGATWRLFAFSQNPVTGVANFVAEIDYIPPVVAGCNLADITGIGGPPSAPDGLLTGDDFNAFISAFAAGDLLADVTGIGGPPSLPDGLVTGDDFNAFVAAFANGCP